MAKAPSRFVTLQGCFNFRDLGGYRTQDGRSVKWLRLFRSDAIHYATPDDISRLQGELGIFTVLDLRNPEEIQRGGLNTMAGSSVRYHSVPYLGARTMAQLEGNLVGLGVTLDEAQTAALDEVSTPTLGFPIPFLEMAHNFMHAGATVDGVLSERFPLAPVSDEERY